MARWRDTEMDSRLLDILKIQPMTEYALSERLGIPRRNVNHFTRRLLAEDRLHICGHDRAHPTGGIRRILAAGPGLNVTFIPKHPRKPPQGDRYATRRACVLAALKTKGTSRELSERVGITQTRTLYYILNLRNGTPRLARIESWRVPGKAGQWVPVYALGSDPDAPHPVGTPQRQDKPGYLAPVDTRQTIARALARPQNPFSALGL